LPHLRSFDLPIAIGPSRKSFLKKEGEDETEFATAAAVAASIMCGCHIVRVHDVKAMKAVVDAVDVIQQAREQEEAEEKAKAEPPPRPRVRPVESDDGREPIKRLRPRLKDAPTPPGRYDR